MKNVLIIRNDELISEWRETIAVVPLPPLQYFKEMLYFLIFQILLNSTYFYTVVHFCLDEDKLIQWKIKTKREIINGMCQLCEESCGRWTGKKACLHLLVKKRTTVMHKRRRGDSLDKRHPHIWSAMLINSGVERRMLLFCSSWVVVISVWSCCVTTHDICMCCFEHQSFLS